MRQKLTVIKSPNTQPVAHVPEHAVWGVVEYLSYQRVRVSYSYEGDHFTVKFLQSDAETAQRLMDEWSSAEHLQPAY